MISLLASIRTSISIKGAIVIENIDEFKLVPFAAFEVVRVVRWRHFYCASTKLHIHEFGIEHDGDSAVDERMDKIFSVEMSVARIIGMDGDSGIAKHCFWTRCRDYDPFVYHLGGISVCAYIGREGGHVPDPST